jgi:hypothetical protein
MRIGKPGWKLTGQHDVISGVYTHIEGWDGEAVSLGILQDLDQIFASDDTAVPNITCTWSQYNLLCK